MGRQDRYSRQILLKELGSAGQEKLAKAKVLVIGAGGLGSPALQYLVAAGVGTIGIVDFDTVELSNLQRQILFSVDDIHKPKAEVAARKLAALNPDVKFNVYNKQITNQNALSILCDYDLVLDGSDNFETRYLVNDACLMLNKPLVYGAVLRFEGQLAVFNLPDEKGKKTSYRDLYPAADASTTLSCNDAGVLGVIPGIIGTMQAAECIKIITGIGKPLNNALLTYNAINNAFYTFEIAQTNAVYPNTKEAFENYNYAVACNAVQEIDAKAFEEWKLQKDILIVDVREEGELPVINDLEHEKLPLSKIESVAMDLKGAKRVLFFCNSGQRSKQAIQHFQKQFPGVEMVNLKGGIVNCLEAIK